MPRDPRTYLWDALRAVELICQFVDGKLFADYETDTLLSSAVERQLEIVGESLNQLAKTDADLAQQIPELPRIVAFRNILIHGYATVDDAIVWQVVSQKLPTLEEVLRALLAGTAFDPGLDDDGTQWWRSTTRSSLSRSSPRVRARRTRPPASRSTSTADQVRPHRHHGSAIRRAALIRTIMFGGSEPSVCVSPSWWSRTMSSTRT